MSLSTTRLALSYGQTAVLEKQSSQTLLRNQEAAALESNYVRSYKLGAQGLSTGVPKTRV